MRGDLAGFFMQHALMGPFSLLLRAPLVALVFDSSIDVVYFVGVLPCMAAVLMLAVVLRRRMTELGRPAAAITLVTVVVLLNTGIFRSVHWGHPEEFLGRRDVRRRGARRAARPLAWPPRCCSASPWRPSSGP